MLPRILSWIIYETGITGVLGKHFRRQGDRKNGLFNPFPKMSKTLHPRTMV